MNLPVILRRWARFEFDEAADWYEARRTGQGVAFTNAVRKVLVGLGSQPDLHPLVHGDVREALVARYPYAVYYRVGPTEVIVLAIFHTSRDPSDWQGRA